MKRGARMSARAYASMQAIMSCPVAGQVTYAVYLYILLAFMLIFNGSWRAAV